MYQDLLSQFIAFKSISTDKEFTSQIDACASWLLELFEEHGFETHKLEGYGNPLVVAKYTAGDDLPTLLIYGHYDVQPADQDDGRQSDPFVLTEKSGRLIARGAVDNKGQIMIHIATVLELIKSGDLAYNITFLIEGDEETGGGDLHNALTEHRDLLEADYALISDGEIVGNHTPTLVAGFRGGMNATLRLQTANTDVHSGIYGNILPSASHEAAKLVAKLYDANNRIAIPGRYDDLTTISDEILMNNTKVPYDLTELQSSIGARAFIKDKQYDYATMVGLLPTIQVSGLQTGYTGNGYKNIIPGSALIKINFRFGPGQDPQAKQSDFKSFVRDHLPEYVSREFSSSDPYEAIVVNTDHEFSYQSAQILSEVYGVDPLYRYAGGAVPVSGLLQDILGVDLVVADLGNEDCNMHGINENFDLVCVEKGLEFSRKLLQKN